ncbi:MAG: TonB-dependent receptor [Paludibacteraceae bacterium]
MGTGLINKFGIDARLSSLISDGYIDRASVNMKSYYISGGYYAEKTLLKFITFGGTEKTYQSWNGVDLDKHPRTYNESGEYTDENNKPQFYDNQTDNYGQYNYQLLLTQVLSPSLTLNGALHYTRGNGYYEEYKQNKSYAEYGLTPAEVDGIPLKKTDLVRQKWLDNHFGGATFSLNYNQKKYSLILGGAANRYSGDHFGKVIWARNANNLMPDHQYYFNTGTKTDANIYLKANYEIIENLTAYADLQYRHILLKMNGEDEKRVSDSGARPSIDQEHPFNFFNPKAGLNYQFSKNNNIFASFAVANREPNRNNYTDALANENPTGERLYDTELGYKFQSKKISLGINTYYMKYKNQLILTGAVNEIGEPLTTNISNSYRTGIELIGGINIYKGLRWDGNTTVSQNKIRNFTEYLEAYDENGNFIEVKTNYFKTTNIAYSPNVIANSIFSFSIGGFSKPHLVPLMLVNNILTILQTTIVLLIHIL